MPCSSETLFEVTFVMNRLKLMYIVVVTWFRQVCICVFCARCVYAKCIVLNDDAKLKA